MTENVWLQTYKQALFNPKWSTFFCWYKFLMKITDLHRIQCQVLSNLQQVQLVAVACNYNSGWVDVEPHTEHSPLLTFGITNTSKCGIFRFQIGPEAADAANRLINICVCEQVSAIANWCCHSDSIHHHMQSMVLSKVPITTSDNLEMWHSPLNWMACVLQLLVATWLPDHEFRRFCAKLAGTSLKSDMLTQPVFFLSFFCLSNQEIDTANCKQSTHCAQYYRPQVVLLAISLIMSTFTLITCCHLPSQPHLSASALQTRICNIDWSPRRGN